MDGAETPVPHAIARRPFAPRTVKTHGKRGRPPKYEAGEAGECRGAADTRRYPMWYHRLLRNPEATVLGEILGNDDNSDILDVPCLFN